MDFPITPEFWWSTDILSSSNFLQGVDQIILPCGQGKIDSVTISPSQLLMRECVEIKNSEIENGTFQIFRIWFFLDPPPLSSAMVSICLMPLPPGHPPSDLRDPPFPLRTFKFKHKHFLSCHFNEHRCFVLSWLYIATPSLHILLAPSGALVVIMV